VGTCMQRSAGQGCGERIVRQALDEIRDAVVAERLTGVRAGVHGLDDGAELRAAPRVLAGQMLVCSRNCRCPLRPTADDRWTFDLTARGKPVVLVDYIPMTVIAWQRQLCAIAGEREGVVY
jgi:hypothetical protein